MPDLVTAFEDFHCEKVLLRASVYSPVGVSGAGSKVIPLCSSEDEPVVFTAVATRKPRTSSSPMHSPLSDAVVDAKPSMSYAERCAQGEIPAAVRV